MHFLFFVGVLGFLKITDVKGEVNLAEATVHETEVSGSGKTLSLRDETELMGDLSSLSSKGIPSVAQICVKGTWLVYGSTDFVVTSKKKVGILSGDKVCGNVNDYGKILSLQSATSQHDRKDNSIALFPDRYFGGRVHSIDSSKASNPGAPPAQSLITLGKQDWALYPDMGDPVCLSPQGSDHFPICFVPKLIDGQDILSGKFIDIQKGCNEQLRNKTVRVKFCTSYDSKKILRIDDLGAKMQGKTFKRAVIKPTEIDECKTDGILDEDGVDLIRIRLTEDLTSNENLMWPKDKSRIWMLELLERSFHILFATCPMELIPKEYAQLVREIFIFQWDRQMSQPDVIQNMTAKKIDEQRYFYLNRLLEECLEQATSNPEFANEIIEPALENYGNLAEMDDWKEAIDPILMLIPENDIVIETVWLVANHVAATCHHAMNFVVNFWADFIELFNQLYLTIMANPWTEPGNWNTAYKYVLGGYNVKRTYNKLAVCASVSNRLIENLDPFHRPYQVSLRKK